MKFRKKPVIIEAEQWSPDNPVEGVIYPALGQPMDKGWIYTLEGGYIVNSGDWIITGVVGEKYPCKPDIFEKTYERVGVG